MKHTPLECPYRQSLYCAVCMAYGHSRPTCPDKIAWAIRRGRAYEHLTNKVLRIPDSEDGIRDFLRSKGLKPTARKLENKKLLTNYANSLKPPHLILYTP